jgi:hypothetical protein
MTVLYGDLALPRPTRGPKLKIIFLFRINRRHVVVVDDVTQMNATVVDRIFFPKDISDVQHIVKLARKNRKQVFNFSLVSATKRFFPVLERIF